MRLRTARFRFYQWILRVAALGLWRLRAFGVGNVPREGGVILASNHQSFLDPVLVGCCLPREVHFMARRSLFKNPVFGALIAGCNAFAIERDAADVKGVKEAIARLRAGCALMVFPEGTRTRDGSIGSIRPGIGMLAERAAVPIVPVLIDGAYETWPKAQPLPGLGAIRVYYDRPFRVDGNDEMDAGRRIRDAMVRLKGEIKGCPTAD